MKQKYEPFKNKNFILIGPLNSSNKSFYISRNIKHEVLGWKTNI